MTAVSHQVTFGGERIHFVLDRTARRKTIAISVGYDGVRVLAPRTATEDTIHRTVHRRAPWILRKLASFAELGQRPPPREFVSGEAFQYLGHAYRLKVMKRQRVSTTRIKASGAHLLALTPSSLSAAATSDAVRQSMIEWYKQHAEVHARTRARFLSERLGVTTPAIRIVGQSKRWGSCDAKGVVRLNWRLFMAPTALIDYVLAHEMCHLIERRHSRRFWRQLEILIPDFDERIRRLDHVGASLFW